jgi:hypothetical protein
MKTWTTDAARAMTSPQEVQLATRRTDGTLRRPRVIWIVRDGERVFIRSTNGRSADWFRSAIATGAGQVTADGTAYDVRFTHVDDESDLGVADAGYRAKYTRYRSIVDHLQQDGPRAATLEVHPA